MSVNTARVIVSVVLVLQGCGGRTAQPSSSLTLSGLWSFSISAPSCLASVPFGYAVAPRGGGTATVEQTGDMLSGELFIFGNPAGTISGTVGGTTVALTFNLDGRNVRVLSPTDEPCRVVGSGSGVIDHSCSMFIRFSGDFACPYHCTASNDFLVMSRNAPGCGRS